jgi:mannose-6-phosphate isomerase
MPRVLVCIDGNGQLDYNGDNYVVGKGDVWLLPAMVGACAFSPLNELNLLEVALPE